MPRLIAPALLCLLMGFAMQRGSTCCLGATYELLRARRSARLVAIAEAALWVLALAGVAEFLGVAVAWPSFARSTLAAAAGGVLLGVGACVNGACVMGAVARIGAGDWAYLWTPVGFFAACGAAARLELLPRLDVQPPVTSSARSIAALAALAAAVALVLWRKRRGAPARERAVRPREWTPHGATIVIGIAFSALLLMAGNWTYTDALRAAASGDDAAILERGLWVACLVVGSIAGGASAGVLRATFPTLRSQLNCFAGGALIGVGSLLVPGGNDTLVLLGLPMLSAPAWVATVAMFGAMAVAIPVRLAREKEAASSSRGSP